MRFVGVGFALMLLWIGLVAVAIWCAPVAVIQLAFWISNLAVYFLVGAGVIAFLLQITED